MGEFSAYCKFPDRCAISRFCASIWYTIHVVSAFCCNDGLENMKTESGLLIAFIICLLFTAACGQKGPLFLPGRPSTIESMVPEQQPAPVEESEEDDEEQTDNIN